MLMPTDTVVPLSGSGSVTDVAQPVGQHLGVGGLGVLADDAELVAAQAGRGVAGPQHRAQPLGEGDQHQVAHRVARARR